MESKRLSFVLIVIASLLTVLITPAAVTGESPPVDSDLGWSLQTVDTFARINWLRDRSIAVDPSGRPHIAYCAYRDRLDCYQLKYASWTGTAWDIQTLTNRSGAEREGSGYSAALALDGTGRPHIVEIEFAYPGAPGVLKYATWSGSAWQFETVEDQGDLTENVSLALDASGVPRASYYDQHTRALKYVSGSFKW